LVYRVEDGQVFKALFAQQFDKSMPRTPVVMLYGSGHHVSAEANIA
jgi:hypothetical protein